MRTWPSATTSPVCRSADTLSAVSTVSPYLTNTPFVPCAVPEAMS
jgi:hypothetical protein